MHDLRLVDGSVRMPMHPKRHLLAPHKTFPAIGIRGIHVGAGMWVESAQRWCMESDYNRWLAKWLRQLHAQPVFRLH